MTTHVVTTISRSNKNYSWVRLYIFASLEVLRLSSVMEGLGRKEGEKLSADQLRRMEENRRKAQERLSNKRALSSLPPSSSVLGGGRPPPAKRPAISVASSSSQGVADQRHLGGVPHWQGALLR